MEAIATAKHTLIYRTLPTTKDYPAQNINNATVERTRSTHCSLMLMLITSFFFKCSLLLKRCFSPIIEICIIHGFILSFNSIDEKTLLLKSHYFSNCILIQKILFIALRSKHIKIICFIVDSQNILLFQNLRHLVIKKYFKCYLRK